MLEENADTNYFAINEDKRNEEMVSFLSVYQLILLLLLELQIHYESCWLFFSIKMNLKILMTRVVT